MNRLLMKIASAFTIITFATTALFAGNGAAMLYPTGAVLLNGNAVPGATAMFKGDLVTTNGSSIASLSTDNSRIALTSQTSVKMEDKGLNLRSGVVTVDTKGGYATHAAQYVVAPSEGTGKYRVVRKGDQILVASLEGPLSVKWGTNSHAIAAGASWASPNDGSGEPQQSPQPQPAGKMPNDKGLGTGTLIVIGAGMAGLAAGLALSVSNGHPVSPIRP